MRAALALVSLLSIGLLAPAALAAPPQDMIFNGKPIADVRGPVRGVGMDGPGRWGGVAVADAGLTLPEDQDLHVYGLPSGSPWQALDEDLVNEGAKMVVVANGTDGQEGAWLVLVNNSVPSVLTVYRTSGFGIGGSPGKMAWQVNPETGPINGADISNRGDLVAIASGPRPTDPSTSPLNKSVILYRNRFPSQPPLQLFRASGNNTQYADVVRFTDIALSRNSTVPPSPDSNRALYTVVGAETATTGGVQGRLYVFETVFSPLLDSPPTTQVLAFDTSHPVTQVDITADGEYAVAGTDQGQLYLVSVSKALQRRGATGIDDQLRAWQQSLGSAITDLDIAHFGGEFLAAGTQEGDVFVFRSQRNPSGSEGAQAVPVGSANASTPACLTARLAGPISSLAMTDQGDQVVAGALNGLLSFEAKAYALFRPGPFEPAWCVQLPQGDVRDGVFADVSGDGRRVFAGSGHRVFGYTNFHKMTVDPDEPARTGSPGQRVQWALTVRNDGSLFDRVNLTAGGPLDPGWQFALSNTSLLLMPGKSQTVLLNVTSPPSIAPGNFTLKVVAMPERAGAPIEAFLRLDLAQLRRVEIRPAEGILVATAGIPNTFLVTIHNGGNAADRFRVSAEIPDADGDGRPDPNFFSPGSDWSIRVDPIEVEIPANSDGTVNLIVTPQAQRGDSATIQVSVEAAVLSPGQGIVADTKQVIVAVEPSYNGDIALVETKDFRAEPGQLIFINYTVKNLGNSRDIFQVKNRTEPANAPGWKLTLGDERFELLRQNQQHVVRLSIFAQQGLQPGESVRIIVELFSEGLKVQNPGSDGQVDSQSVTVTVVPKARRGIPMAAEPLVFLAVLALAALGRRGGRG